jgi:SagB-type dehydrogenase family enzyme
VKRLTVTLVDTFITDHVLDTEVVVDGRHETQARRVTADECSELELRTRPSLVLGTRIYADGQTVHLCPPLGEPALMRVPHSTLVRRRRRDVTVAGDLEILWNLLRRMDGQCTAGEMLGAIREEDQRECADLLRALISAGVVDVSGRHVGRFLHSSTKKGVLPGAGLHIHEVLELVTDGKYREYPEAQAFRVREDVPEQLAPLHAVLRARRSYRDFNGAPIQRAELDSLLSAACGVTGAIQWAGREVKLRAYPSSGGLYAVEIYPVTFAVEGLPCGVYHYCAPKSRIELVRRVDGHGPFLDTALPSEREMLAGVAVMICMTAVFGRHEAKYGEGGYRMLVAEAGHISQNLLLTAAALGLDARPFGGVFDEMLNRSLGLQTDEEQFLLSVIAGHAGGHGPTPSL